MDRLDRLEKSTGKQLWQRIYLVRKPGQIEDTLGHIELVDRSLIDEPNQNPKNQKHMTHSEFKRKFSHHWYRTQAEVNTRWYKRMEDPVEVLRANPETFLRIVQEGNRIWEQHRHQVMA